MTADRRMLRVGALGAALAVTMLAVLALTPLPIGEDYPGRTVLTGAVALAPDVQVLYVSTMQQLLILDGFFIIGWLLAWIGVAMVVSVHHPLLGWLTLIFGVAGALFDLGENSIIWSVVQMMAASQPPGDSWLLPWSVVRHLSYWLPFLGALIALSGLWSERPFERILVGVIGAALFVAVIGLYAPVLALAADAWFLVWFAGCALLLWRIAAVIGS